MTRQWLVYALSTYSSSSSVKLKKNHKGNRNNVNTISILCFNNDVCNYIKSTFFLLPTVFVNF